MALRGRGNRRGGGISTIIKGMADSRDLPIRPRRLRTLPQLRSSLAQTRLHRSDFIVPVFVREGRGVKREVPSMPGVFQMSVDVATDWLGQLAEQGITAFLAFGVIESSKKDAVGSAALDEKNVVCRLLQQTKSQKIPMTAITDLCFCEYTSHGHCGILRGEGSDKVTVDNDATVQRLVQQAVNHARAGADLIAPSGMMDGAVAAIRAGLDAERFSEVAILAYAVKYASAFYGPFRDAAESAPQFGDRKSYQMDPAGGVREAIREAKLDVEQGADLVMVKPAGPYLDILAAVRSAVEVPVVGYQVSGEYAMLQAAAKQKWIDGDAAALESLLAIKRAGADLIVTYFAPMIAKMLPT
jgi:porphobilinogen synthase